MDIILQIQLVDFVIQVTVHIRMYTYILYLLLTYIELVVLQCVCVHVVRMQHAFLLVDLKSADLTTMEEPSPLQGYLLKNVSADGSTAAHRAAVGNM